MHLETLAKRLGAELRCATDRDSRMELVRVASHAAAGGDALVFATDERTFAMALASGAGAVIVSAIVDAANAEKPLLVVPEAKLAFARAAQLLRVREAAGGVSGRASVAETARLGERVTVGAFAVIEEDAEIGADCEIGAGAVIGMGCRIGSECRIYPRAVLYPGTILGDRVVVHAGAVLGSDGFGYVRDAATGEYVQFPQQGVLVLEDDVEIGANTTIDRGALEETRIGRGTKLDNLVHVGHNVSVGAQVVIAAQTGVSGSSSIGAGAVLAGQVGIADHVEIGEGAILGAQCGVPSGKKIKGPGVLFWGTPARPITQYLKELATLARMTKDRRAR